MNDGKEPWPTAEIGQMFDGRSDVICPTCGCRTMSLPPESMAGQIESCTKCGNLLHVPYNDGREEGLAR